MAAPDVSIEPGWKADSILLNCLKYDIIRLMTYFRKRISYMTRMRIELSRRHELSLHRNIQSDHCQFIEKSRKLAAPAFE
jgi:hypothetical protein